MKDIITIEEFIKNRPDMEVHTDTAIQSCINQSKALLDSETNGLLIKVWEANQKEILPSDELYRTQWELKQLQEAMITQTQYMLNIGNDLSVGGGSYSIGNINSSYSRPIDRPTIAPGVFKLLQNGRVYNLNFFLNDKDKDKNRKCSNWVQEVEYLGDKRYVKVHQPEATIGNVAYINQQNMVDFGSPQDLNITTYNTTKIAGGEGYRNDFYEIDNVPNIAFFGNDLDGPYSAVHRGEFNKIEEYTNEIKEQVKHIATEHNIEALNKKVDTIDGLAMTNQEDIETFNNKFMEYDKNLGENGATIKQDLGDLGEQVVDFNNDSKERDKELKEELDIISSQKQDIMNIGEGISLVNNVLSISQEYLDKITKMENVINDLLKETPFGSLEFEILNENGEFRINVLELPYRFRNVKILNQIHITTLYVQSNNDNKVGFSEFIPNVDNVWVLDNPIIGEVYNTPLFRTPQFKDRNLLMFVYIWWNWNPEFVENHGTAKKTIMCVTSRHSRDGVSNNISFRLKKDIYKTKYSLLGGNNE